MSGAPRRGADGSPDIGDVGTGDVGTLAWYDANAADYADWSPRTEAPTLIEFLRRVPPGARLLDLGCGGGWASVEMIAEGHEVRALDASPGLVAEARARGVPAEVGRFEALEDEGLYDGAWVSFSLLHAPLATWPDCLSRIRRALKPGGVLFLGLKEGEGEARDRLGRRYAYMTPDPLRALLAEVGFGDIEMDRMREVGRDGVEGPVLLTLARRKED